MPRPEVQAPPEIFYNESEARKYTTSSRIIEIQAKISERALEMLALPNDGVPKMLLDIGCGSGLSCETLTEHGHHWIGCDISESMLDVALERETDGDLLLADMGEGLGPRPGVFDGAISISAVQWLCNADKSSHEPTLRLKCLARGARVVLQFYADNVEQTEMLVSFAMKAGFAGGVVVDWPHSSKAKKSYLVFTCCSPSVHTSLPKAKGQDGEMCSSDDDDDDDDGSNDDQTKKIPIGIPFVDGLEDDDNDQLCETTRDKQIQAQAMNPEPEHHGSALGTRKRKRVTRSRQPKRTKLILDEYEAVISSSSSDEDMLLPSITESPITLSLATVQKNRFQFSSHHYYDWLGGHVAYVGTYGRTRSNKRRKFNNRKNGRAKDWLLRKKEQMRRRGRDVPADTKYTGRKRKTRF